MGRCHLPGPQKMKISRDGKPEKNPHVFFRWGASDFLCPFVVRCMHTHTTLNNIISQANHSGNAFFQKTGSNGFRRLRSSQHSIFRTKQETVEAGRGAPAPGSVPGWALGAGDPGRMRAAHFAPALPTAALRSGWVGGRGEMSHHSICSGPYADPKHHRL